jgi:hypothetical protein
LRVDLSSGFMYSWYQSGPVATLAMSSGRSLAPPAMA